MHGFLFPKVHSRKQKHDLFERVSEGSSSSMLVNLLCGCYRHDLVVKLHVYNLLGWLMPANNTINFLTK
eukprot:scaffold172147_cov19-Tisochrysis_lutea.AAC.2